MASPQEASTFISKKSMGAGMVVIGLAVALAGGYFWWRSRPSPPPYAGPAEKLSIAATTFSSTLLWVAEHNGYFQEHGLNVTINMYQAGLFAFNELMAGRVQVAACAELILATKILDGMENVRSLGTIGSSRDHRIFARKDRGIAQPEDLAGKRIAVIKNTTGEFFLDVFLTLHGLAGEQVQLVNLKPQEMFEALSRGQVDAVLTWGHSAFDIEKQMGEQVLIWPAQVYQPYFWMLLTTTQLIQDNPEVLIRLFRALARAEEFVKQHPGAAKDITTRHLNNPLDFIENVWPMVEYALRMDQRILMAVEDEARWAIRHNLTHKKDMPNYLEYLYLEPLAAAKPGAVQLMTWEKKPNQ